MQHLEVQLPAPLRATPALQLWEAFHESKALTVSLKSAARAPSECQHLSELLESVSELLYFVFSWYNDSLFVGTLNSHVQSSAQLLHFGLLKVCRVVGACCTNSCHPTSFAQASITSTATSAAADIQLAVTVLATAVQYLEATCGKQSEAAATQISHGPTTLQQAPLLAKGAVPAASMRYSIGRQKQLAGDAHAVELFTTAAPALAGHVTAATAGASNTCRASCCSETDAQQPEVVAELTFAAKTGADTVAGEQIDMLDEQVAEQQQQRHNVQSCEQQISLDQRHALNKMAEQHTAVQWQAATAQVEATATDADATAEPTAADPVESAAYTTARLQALYELLKPGSTWCLEDSGANFVCSASSNTQQHQQLAVEPLSALDCQQSGSHADEQKRSSVSDVLPPAAEAAAASAGTMPVVGEGRDEFDPTYCSDIQSTKVPLTPEELRRDQLEQQEQQCQSVLIQERQLSSTARLQQQLQQVYSNTLLQGRKQQQARHMMLRRSKELLQGVAALSEVLPSPKEQLQHRQQARAESPEPAGWGIGFVSAGYNSSSGSGGRSLRMSTEGMVENVLGWSFAERAASAPGGQVLAVGRAVTAGALAAASYAASAAAASEGFFVPYIKAATPRKSKPAGKARGSSAPGSTAGSTRVSREFGSMVGSSTPVFSGSSGMVSSGSSRGYANWTGSYTFRSVSAAGSLRSSGDAAQSGSMHISPRSQYISARGSSATASLKLSAATAAPICSTNGRKSGNKSSLRTGRNSYAAGTAASHAPHRYSSSGSFGQSKVSKESILSSSPGSVVLSSSGAGSGSSAGRYYSFDEALTAAAASYASARSSVSSSGLVRYSSAGSAVVRAGSSTGSTQQFRVSRGALKEPKSCRVTSVAGTAVINMLAAATAGAEVAAAGAAAAGGVRAGAIVGSDVDWLCTSGTASAQQSRRCSWTGKSSMSGDEVIHAVRRHALCPHEPPPPDAGTARAACITAHGCLTLGSCGGVAPGSSRLGSSNGSRNPVVASLGGLLPLIRHSTTEASGLPNGLSGSSSLITAVCYAASPLASSSGGQQHRSISSGSTGGVEQQQGQAGSRPASSSGQYGSSSGTTSTVEQQQQQPSGFENVDSGGQHISTADGSCNASTTVPQEEQRSGGQPGCQGGVNYVTVGPGSAGVEAIVLQHADLDVSKAQSTPAHSSGQSTAAEHGIEASSNLATDHVIAKFAAGAGPAAAAVETATSSAADLVAVTAMEPAFIAAATQDTKQGRKASAANLLSLSAGAAVVAAACQSCADSTDVQQLNRRQQQEQQITEQVTGVVTTRLTEQELQQEQLLPLPEQQQGNEALAVAETTGNAVAGAAMDEWQQPRQQWQQQWEQQQLLWQQQVSRHTEGRSSAAICAIVSHDNSRCEEVSDATRVPVQETAAAQGNAAVQAGSTAGDAATPGNATVHAAAVQDDVVVHEAASAQQDTAAHRAAEVHDSAAAAAHGAAVQEDTGVHEDAAMQEDSAAQGGAEVHDNAAVQEDMAAQGGTEAHAVPAAALQDTAGQECTTVDENAAAQEHTAVHANVFQNHAAVHTDAPVQGAAASSLASIDQVGCCDDHQPEAAATVPTQTGGQERSAFLVAVPNSNATAEAAAAYYGNEGDDDDFGDFQGSDVGAKAAAAAADAPHPGGAGAAVTGEQCSWESGSGLKGTAQCCHGSIRSTAASAATGSGSGGTSSALTGAQGSQQSDSTTSSLTPGTGQSCGSSTPSTATAGAAVASAQLLTDNHNKGSFTVDMTAAQVSKDAILRGMQTMAEASDETANRSSLMVHSSVALQQQQQQPLYQQTAAQTSSCHAAAAAVLPQASPEAAAEVLLAEGNAAYTAGRYNLAVQSYSRALDKLGGSIASTSSASGVLLWVKCSLNLACTHLRLRQFKQCVSICDGLLEVDPANIVALCHRGRALLMVQQYAAAKADLTEALQLLEDEAAEQQHQQQYHLAQQQQQLLGQEAGSQGGAGLDSVAGQQQKSQVLLSGAAAASSAASDVDGAVRISSRCLTPCTLARMRLNNSYWQHRVMELLSGLKK